MISVDAAFFSHYDALGAEAASLSNAKSALDAATAALNKCKQDLLNAKNALLKNEAYAKEQRDRIKLVSEHWFFGNTALQPQLWLRGGTEGKIGRAKAKLEQCETEQPNLANAVNFIERTTLPPLQQAADQCRSANERKHKLEADCKGMFDQAVAANVSPTLTQLQGQDAALQSEVTATQQNAQALHAIAAQCIEGRQHYERAAARIREAQRLNNAAVAEHSAMHAGAQSPPGGGGVPWQRDQVVRGPNGEQMLAWQAQQLAGVRPCPGGCGYRVTWHATHCCNACQRHAGQHGPRCERIACRSAADAAHEAQAARRAAEEREKADQAMRDRKMHEAQKEADRGADALRRTLGGVPGAVRERFPAQCAALAAVEWPQLAQNHAGTKMLEFFGGAGGNLLAEWQSGDKLRSNLALLQHAAAVAQQQEQTVRQLEAQLRQHADQSAQQRQRVREAIDAERRRIFGELRARATGAAPPPPPAAAAMSVPMAPPMAPPQMAPPQMAPPQMAPPAPGLYPAAAAVAGVVAPPAAPPVAMAAPVAPPVAIPAPPPVAMPMPQASGMPTMAAAVPGPTPMGVAGSMPGAPPVAVAAAVPAAPYPGAGMPGSPLVPAGCAPSYPAAATAYPSAGGAPLSTYPAAQQQPGASAAEAVPMGVPIA